jgi:hypothetical protein
MTLKFAGSKFTPSKRPRNVSMPDSIMFMNWAMTIKLSQALLMLVTILYTLLKDVLCMLPNKIQMVQDNHVDDEWTSWNLKHSFSNVLKWRILLRYKSCRIKQTSSFQTMLTNRTKFWQLYQQLLKSEQSQCTGKFHASESLSSLFCLFYAVSVIV